jgi:hypothetical protein
MRGPPLQTVGNHAAWLPRALLLAGLQAGAILAVALSTAVSVWFAIQREVYPVKLLEMLEKATTKMRQGRGKGGAPAAAKPDAKSVENAQRLSNLLAKVGWAWDTGAT